MLREQQQRIRYKLDQPYSINFQQAYRKQINPTASIQECSRLREAREYQLVIPMDKIPFLDKYLPMQPISEAHRHKFFDRKNPTVKLLDNAKAMDMTRLSDQSSNSLHSQEQHKPSMPSSQHTSEETTGTPTKEYREISFGTNTPLSSPKLQINPPSTSSAMMILDKPVLPKQRSGARTQKQKSLCNDLQMDFALITKSKPANHSQMKSNQFIVKNKTTRAQAKRVINPAIQQFLLDAVLAIHCETVEEIDRKIVKKMNRIAGAAGGEEFDEGYTLKTGKTYPHIRCHKPGCKFDIMFAKTNHVYILKRKYCISHCQEHHKAR